VPWLGLLLGAAVEAALGGIVIWFVRSWGVLKWRVESKKLFCKSRLLKSIEVGERFERNTSSFACGNKMRTGREEKKGTEAVRRARGGGWGLFIFASGGRKAGAQSVKK